MKHLGDISKIHGAKIEPVDLITFGSPCQDLSVAGKRAGLKHETNGDEETTRSGLFMEAVRIIKEMREATDGKYPRFALWENVPGAFSSNKGEDFRIVLEEIAKIAEKEAVMPAVPKGGWAYADCFSGDRWSMAYRVFDAQHWGVPQRRRRIYLVADFAGERAEEILFKREGLRGHLTASPAPRERITAYVEGGSGAENRERKCYGISSFSSNAMLSDNPHSGIYEANTSRTLDLNGGNPACNQGGIAVVEPISMATQQGGAEIRTDDKAPTVTAAAGMSGNNQPVICYPDIAQTLSARHDGAPQPDKGNGANIVVMSAGFKAGQGVHARGIGWEEEQTPTLASEAGGNSVPSVCVAFAQNQRDEVRDLGGVAGSLEAESGMKQQTFIMEQHLFENHSQDSRYKGPLDVCPILPAQLGTGGNNQPFVVEKPPVFSLQGNVIDLDAKQNSMGVREGVSYPLNTIDKHGVVYCMAHGQANAEVCEGKCPCLNCNHEQPIIFDKEVYTSGENCKGGHYIAEGGPAPTLRTGVPPGVSVEYIVRRLTPTECARLQGFADRWGHVEPKDSISPEEYEFWLKVRNTYAAINGKQVKDYTEKQMLTWYNKLHTDSAEYKMWGNGIALPTALYCMQGIADALEEDAA